MSTPSVEVETRGSVALVTLSRPEAGNAINLQLAMDLLAAALSCARSSTVRAVVLTGAGRNFCFGGDLRAISAHEAADDYVRELTGYLHAAISHFVRMNAPVIAAVNGTAAGAGVGLAAMADLAVCGAGARFVLAYTQAGLTPDAGTSFFLPRIIGSRRSAELMLTNRALPARQALDWGLVNEVIDDEQLLARALELAGSLARGATAALGRTKRLAAHSIGALESHMVLESEAISSRVASEEGREGLRAFIEKRAPRFGPESGG